MDPSVVHILIGSLNLWFNNPSVLYTALHKPLSLFFNGPSTTLFNSSFIAFLTIFQLCGLLVPLTRWLNGRRSNGPLIT